MPFRFDKLTTKAQSLVAEAQAQATSKGNPEISPLHLMAAMLDESDGITRPLLEKMKVDAGRLKELVVSELGRLPAASGGRQAGVSPSLQQVFESAATAAESLKDEYVSTEHLLLGLARVDGKVKNLLKMLGVDENDVLESDEPGARFGAGHRSECRGHLSSPREIRHRPDQIGSRGQA